jgi:hypothetical protein
MLDLLARDTSDRFPRQFHALLAIIFFASNGRKRAAEQIIPSTGDFCEFAKKSQTQRGSEVKGLSYCSIGKQENFIIAFSFIASFECLSCETSTI